VPIGIAPTRQQLRSWRGHPLAAASIRLLAFTTPIVAALLWSAALSRLITSPRDLPGRAAWLIGMLATSTGVLFFTERLARRMLPLAALLKLSLVFPDQVPSRFSIALRTVPSGESTAVTDQPGVPTTTVLDDAHPAGGEPTANAPTATTLPTGAGPATTGGPLISVPATSVPAPTVPATSTPLISLPPISVPPITVPITIPLVTVPPITLPVITVPPISVPAITLPVITLPKIHL
jgi:hypothetical protein